MKVPERVDKTVTSICPNKRGNSTLLCREGTTSSRSVSHHLRMESWGLDPRRVVVTDFIIYWILFFLTCHNRVNKIDRSPCISGVYFVTKPLRSRCTPLISFQCFWSWIFSQWMIDVLKPVQWITKIQSQKSTRLTLIVL